MPNEIAYRHRVIAQWRALENQVPEPPPLPE
jgi:hypothetical protein